MYALCSITEQSVIRIRVLVVFVPQRVHPRKWSRAAPPVGEGPADAAAEGPHLRLRSLRTPRGLEAAPRGSSGPLLRR